MSIEVSLSGPFFTRDVTRTIDENTNDAVKWLTERGVPLVRGQLGGLKHPTGFTARAVEDNVLPPRIGSGSFGVVWMKPGLSRGGSSNWPAARVPYIVNAVLESGNWRGRKSPKRTAHKQWYRAFKAMEHMAARINVDLTKGLD